MQYATVRLSEIEQISSRLDAEYYRPAFIESEQQLKRNKWDYLGNLAESIRSFGAYSLCNQIEYRENGIPFLRAKDIKEGFIDFSDVLYIDAEANELLWKSEVEPETVLFTMSGTVGNTAIAPRESDYPINSSQDVAKIRTSQRLNPYYLSIFLQSSYGKRQATRLPVGSVQQHVFLWQLGNLVIPLFEVTFQANLERCFKKVLRLQREAGNSYQEAQTLLLSEIGLVEWQPRQQLTFVRSFSDTKRAGRIDAEHFQPKYDDIISAIRGYPGGWDTLGSLVLVEDRNYKPENKTEYRYIELADIGVNGEITDCMVEEGQDLPSRARRKVAVGDVIVSSIEGSLNRTALISQEYDQALCSTGFHVLNSKELNSETLLVLMKSIVGQLQLKKGCSGTILTAISRHELDKLILPVIPSDIQAHIKQSVTESFSLRKQSNYLLECAKRAVEIAIEQDEQTAIDWLESETYLL